jgi:hypothetical protein|tara:strand:- start:270 stop:512 length:243 start_codon:yes stop_codon:yes gene_type:complete
MEIYKAYIDIIKRSDKLYNVWCLAWLTMPIHELQAYSSRWVCIGVTKTFEKGRTLAHEFFVSDNGFKHPATTYNTKKEVK